MKKQIVAIATAVMMTATMTACSTPTQVVPTTTAESVQEIVLSESDVKSEVDVKPTSTPTTSVKPVTPNGVNVNAIDDVDEDSEPTTQATQKPKETEEVAEQPKKEQGDEQETYVETPKPVTSEKPVVTGGVEIVIPQDEVKPTATPEPVQTPTATLAPTLEPTPEPTPESTPEPVEEMKSLGGSYNSDVLAGVNEVRASQGNAPLVLDSGMCSKALAHAKAMAEKGEIFHSGLGIESVSNSSEGGKSMGIRSAGHAGGLATNGEITKLGVGAVTYKGEQYTVVFSSTRY